MLSQEIRRGFLEAFKKRGHTIVPSSPVIPHDDPTLLFTNAGMNQFKDVFLGKATRDYSRAVSSQKCLRVGGKHNDLDNVGHTSRHHTFFEMLGNFSFGDYFKKEAIAFAWEVTNDLFAFPTDKLWVSVYEKDDEAFELWKEHIDESRIVRIGAADNFWAMGDVGPCGPCSELFFDRGDRYGKAPTPKEDTTGERFIEFWNLVFMQYERKKDGSQVELPNPSVDTGAGLERVCALKIGAHSNFETDLFAPIIAHIEKLSGHKPDVAHNVIADHIRALAFAIADGATPSNVDRGYVLRKVLRRAVRYGRLIGFTQPFLAHLLPPLIDIMGEDYPEIKASQIGEILTIEEESFFKTLSRGGGLLQSIIESSSHEIRAEDAFKLKDTYGMPLDEILLVAKDANLTVNLEAYQLLEEQAKERSRAVHKTHAQQVEKSLFTDFAEKHGTSTFIGYTQPTSEDAITAIIKDGTFVEKLETGEKALIVLDSTPFYPEMGGQIGDSGTLTHDSARFVVTQTTAPYPGVITHHGTLQSGTLLVGEPLVAQIDQNRRANIEKHHTATHLLHWALCKVLGDHIRQAGSLVAEDRLRFDFSHHKALTPHQLREIEHLINQKIWENRPVKTYELSYEQAQKKKEIKQFFGEKYGTKVRVVDIDHFSQELCGGTHVASIGTIGLFRIAKESSIAKGTRRIEAVCAASAESIMYAADDTIASMASHLQVPPHKVEEKLLHLLEENTRLSQAAKAARTDHLKSLVKNLITTVTQAGDTPLLMATVDVEPAELAPLANDLMDKMKSGVILLAIAKERCQLLIKVSPDLTEIHAGNLVKELAPCIDGRGGGKKETAQAGGTNTDGIQKAFEQLYTLLS